MGYEQNWEFVDFIQGYGRSCSFLKQVAKWAKNIENTTTTTTGECGKVNMRPEKSVALPLESNFIENDIVYEVYQPILVSEPWFYELPLRQRLPTIQVFHISISCKRRCVVALVRIESIVRSLQLNRVYRKYKKRVGDESRCCCCRFIIGFTVCVWSDNFDLMLNKNNIILLLDW